jgi:hypothetical protein
MTDDSKVQVYRVPLEPGHPESDCYTHMTAWTDHLQSLLQRPLIKSDFIFPGIASTGQLKFGESTSRTGIEKIRGLELGKFGWGEAAREVELRTDWRGDVKFYSERIQRERL